MADYLLQTPHGWYFRMKVPPDLRGPLGKRELKKALNTSDKRRARLAAIQYAAQAAEIFDALRGRIMKRLPGSSEIVINGFRRLPDGSISFDNIASDPSESAEDFALKLNATLTAVQSIPHVPTNAVVQSPAAPAVKSCGMLLSEAVTDYVAERDATKPWKESYKKDVLATFELIERVLGNVPVASISRNDGVRFFKILRMLPPNLNKNPLYQDLSIPQVLAQKPAQTLSQQTVNNLMSRVIALFDWLVLQQQVHVNPFQGLKVEVTTRASAQRDRFDEEELKRIFHHPVFTAHEMKHPYYFWLPLISLHSGMRMNEICCLKPLNIYEEEGVWVMDVTDEDDDEKSVKTEAGIRRVPVHPNLIRLGFLNFVEERRKQEWIFDGLVFDEGRGSRSRYASKWFTERFRPQVGLKVKGKDFHSFRHTVIDTFKQLDANLYQVKELVGHARELGDIKQDMTWDRYGKGFAARILHDLVSRLDFTDALAEVKPWEGKGVSRLSRPRKVAGASRVKENPAQGLSDDTGSTARHASVFGRSFERAKKEG